MGGQVGRVGHAHMSYYARARVIPDHLVCPIDYPSMPFWVSRQMPMESEIMLFSMPQIMLSYK